MVDWLRGVFVGEKACFKKSSEKSVCSESRAHEETETDAEAKTESKAEDESELTSWFVDTTMEVLGLALSEVVFNGEKDDGHYARGRYRARWNRLLTEKVLRDHPRKKQGHYRVLSAVREGLMNRTLWLTSEEDIAVLDKVLHADFSLYPEIVEKYLKSGELFDAFYLLSRERLNHWISGDNRHQVASRAFRVSMFRLFYYDTMRAREHDASKDEEMGDRGDDENHQYLPLEIRLSFSGFFEPVTFAEDKWDSQVRQQSLPPDAAFDLYGRLYRAQVTGGNVDTAVPADDNVSVVA